MKIFIIGARWHFYAHMLPDIRKAKELLGYKPKYTPEEALRTAVEWMTEEEMSFLYFVERNGNGKGAVSIATVLGHLFDNTQKTRYGKGIGLAFKLYFKEGSVLPKIEKVYLEKLALKGNAITEFFYCCAGRVAVLHQDVKFIL